MKLEIDLTEIAEKGLKSDSPLLWALLPDWAGYICRSFDKEWVVFEFAPTNDSRFWWYGDEKNHGRCFGIGIKIDCTGDWKDSLTKRPEANE